MRNALLIAGVMAVIVGLFWAGQGAGLINWPASSFMVGRGAWVWYGGALALAGLAVVWLSWR